MLLSESDIQADLDRRRPAPAAMSRSATNPTRWKSSRGVYEGRTTGTPIGLLIRNQDQRSRTMATSCRPFVLAMPTMPTGTNMACATRAAADVRPHA